MLGGTVPVNRGVLGELYELIGVFPYFQSAHLLLLKGLHDNSDVKFENQLRNSAIHVADREILYYILNPRSVPELLPEDVLPENSVPEETVDYRVQTVIEEVSEVIIIDESTDITDEDQPSYSDQGIFVHESADDLLEFESGSEQQEAGEEVGEESGTEDETPGVEEKPGSKQLQAELIEKFIITNPRIEPSREKIAGPLEDISNPITHEEGGFVTETLAKIYIGQSYYSKAIDIYEKLSLKFPEKSSYFATQIEKVKEYLKK